MPAEHRVVLVSMSGLRVVSSSLLDLGMRLPGLRKRGDALSRLPPLGLLTVAAYFSDQTQVELVEDDRSLEIGELAERIASQQPRLVAFSALTASADRAAKVSMLLRQRGIQTMLGGLHATMATAWCRQYFDVVLTGDGESAIQNWLSGQEIVPAFSLADSRLPRWDLLGDARPPRYTVQTMRGCPLACSFCAASRVLGPARCKPTGRIIDELAAISRMQKRPWIELADDNTFSMRRDPTPWLEVLGDMRAKWFTESDWRIGERPELLRSIAASGCRQILIGLESDVFNYEGMGPKRAHRDRIMNAIESIQSHGIVVNACFIIGGDGETSKTIENLGDRIEQSPFGEIQVTVQTPFPGTALYTRLLRQQRLLKGDFSRYTLFDVTFKPDRMSVTDLAMSFERLIERVFRPEAQARRDQIVRSIRGK